MKQDGVSEERQVHPQEPAEGSEEDMQAPGAERTGGKGKTAEEAGTQERSRQHPQEPAEGAEEDAGAPGADRASNG